MSADPGSASALLRALLPAWARDDKWPKPLGEYADQILQAAVDAVRLGYPGVTPDDRSLALIGEERRIPRAPNEPADSYARRLKLWLDLWSLAGTPIGLLYALQSFVFPGYPRMRIVERSSLWYTLEEGASRDLTPYQAQTVASSLADTRYAPPIGATQSPRAALWMHRASPANWDWDSISDPTRATHWEDYWVIIYPTSYPIQGTYGGGVFYGSDTCWGLDVSPGIIATLRELLKIYQRAGSSCRAVIFAPTLADFDPTAPPADPGFPDGRWSAHSKDVGGVAVPTRRMDCRYLLKVT
jgi:hypothetical protein